MQHNTNVKYYFLGPTDQKHECQSGGLHPPSKASVNEFVRVARRRIKYMSVCGTGGIMPGDIAAEVNLIVNLLNYNLYTQSLTKKNDTLILLHSISNYYTYEYIFIYA